MILIVESGSTKAQWVLIKDKQLFESFFTEGINPCVQSGGLIEEIVVSQLLPSLFSEKISYIFYYGAGCVGKTQENIIQNVLKKLLNADTKVQSDLYAAAISLFQGSSGIACILGTGSNSGFYDAENMHITKTVPSLGYILGDEGSGSVLGKMFLADCLKGLAPDELVYKFTKEYDIIYPDILERIYKQPSPNRFLSGISLFLTKNKNNQYVSDLIRTNFRSFFDRCISQYDYRRHPVGFIGSIAFFYEDLLKEVALEYGIEIHKVIQTPMKELVKYHTRHLR